MTRSTAPPVTPLCCRRRAGAALAHVWRAAARTAGDDDRSRVSPAQLTRSTSAPCGADASRSSNVTSGACRVIASATYAAS